MLAFMIQSGPFGFLALFIGAVGLVLAFAGAHPRAHRFVAKSALGSAWAAALVGVAGTALGIHVAAQSVLGAGAEEQQSMWLAGLGTAVAPTVLGVASALVILLVVGIGNAARLAGDTSNVALES